ncbi:MAG: DUF1289 domain-containing protein [Hahellaceae bacterium]|nr:DUF1289 domain-containing protein [Hahellaceae bacterium]
MPAPITIPNPCVRNCCLDRDDVCMGCHRTLKEILDWHGYTDEEKRALIEALEQRKKNRSTEA